MKKIIPYILVVSLLVCTLATPVQAAELEFIDLLPYFYKNSDDADINMTYLRDGHAEFSFFQSRFQYLTISYIDCILAAYDNTVIRDMYIGDGSNTFDFTPILIGSQGSVNYYRIYKSFDTPLYVSDGDELSFSVYGTIDGSFSFQKFLISQGPIAEFDVTGSSALYSRGSLQSTGSVPGELRREVSSSTTSAPYNFVYSLNDSKNYDYIDLIIEFQYYHISSVVVELGDQIVDYELSYLSDPNPDDFYYYISLSIDLTGIDRSDPGSLDIRIDGYLDNYGLSDRDYIYSKVWSCVGFLQPSQLDPNLPWYSAIIDSIDLVFSYVNFIYKYLDVQLDNWFSNFWSVLNDFYVDAIWAINNVGEIVYEEMATMQTFLEDYFEQVISILDIDDRQAENFADDLDEQEEAFSGISQSIKVDSPDAGAVTGDVSNIVDFTQVALITAPIGAFFENPLIYGIFLLSFTLMLASYVLYGKR